MAAPIRVVPWAHVLAANEHAPPELRDLLGRIRFPVDLSGRSVLHVDSGDGGLCLEAARRGATRVVGLENDPELLARSRQRAEGTAVEFAQGDRSHLPEGPFDVVIWLDRVQDEREPRRFMDSVRARLSDDGVFILACLVHEAPQKQLKYGPGAQLYPTMTILHGMLGGFVSRVVGRPGPDDGRRLRPWAFWCRLRLPTVMLIPGPGDHGKSRLADMLRPASTKVIALDDTVPELRFEDRLEGKLAEFVARRMDRRNLVLFFRELDSEGLTGEYVEEVLRGISSEDDLVVIEGFMTDLQVETFRERLQGRAYVWETRRR